LRAINRCLESRIGARHDFSAVHFPSNASVLEKFGYLLLQGIGSKLFVGLWKPIFFFVEIEFRKDLVGQTVKLMPLGIDFQKFDFLIGNVPAPGATLTTL